MGVKNTNSVAIGRANAFRNVVLGSVLGSARSFYVRTQFLLQHKHRVSFGRHGGQNQNQQIVQRKNLRERQSQLVRARRTRQLGLRARDGLRRRGVQRQTTRTGQIHERRNHSTPRHDNHQLRSRRGHHVPIRSDQQNGFERSRLGHTGRFETGDDRRSDCGLSERRDEDNGPPRSRRQTVGRSRGPVGSEIRNIGLEQPVRDIRQRTGRHGRCGLQRNRTDRRRRLSDRSFYNGSSLQVCRHRKRKGKRKKNHSIASQSVRAVFVSPVKIVDVKNTKRFFFFFFQTTINCYRINF